MSQLNVPIALKLISSEISHKSDIGGVALNIHHLTQAEEEFERMRRIGKGSFKGVLIQRMASGGKEIILGAKRDPSFGPFVLFGMGGDYVEVFKEASLRVIPINQAEAEEMILESKALPILKGVRGERPLHIEKLVEILLRLSQLVMDFPMIEGMDINPIIVQEREALALDCRILLGAE